MAKFHLPTLEEEQLKKWDERQVFHKVLARNAERDRKPFVFFEGPPTANGKPGIHHLLTRAFKDVILRFKTMQGYRIDRKAGWDTHGLPVELEVEKQLGFTKKQDIEAYGIAKFNAKCRESVWKYLDLWQKSTRRIAFWVDLDDPYITYKNEYVESLWWIMKEIDKKGLLYQGYRVTPHCPRCVTSLSSHELAQGYKDTEDPSVYVKFPIDAAAKKFFLVWTTTPWTLPGNVALAVGPDVIYVEAKMKEGGDTLVLAKERLSVLSGDFEVVKEMSGSDLVGTAYERLYRTLPASDSRAANAYKVKPAAFVSTADGTGIVHIAPAFGEDDAQFGQKYEMPTLLTVDNTGMMLDMPGMPDAAKGKFFKKADDDVKADLTARGLLYKSETYVHSYPFCWRCGTPLLYYAKTSWYIRMSSLREELLKRNEQINWVPSHIKDGRFGEWLKEVKDWALSRERYWGTPLPIWECGEKACGKRTAIGSLDELHALSRPKNRYFLQRHGEAVTNAADTISCWPEPGEFHLTEKGQGQVRATAKKLKDKKIDMIFSSDLLRTKETAEMIAGELGLPITYDQRLRELDVGAFNGKAVKDFHAAAAGLDRFEQKVADTGETLNDVRRRMVDFLKELDRKYSGKNILIVSHGDPLWMLQATFGGRSKDEIKAWPHYNGVGEFLEMETPKNLPYDELGNIDVHRPFIDDVLIACPHCKTGTASRVKDVIDVWFDSGAMPFAQWGYPRNEKEAFRIDEGLNFPADFISEAIDQTRGWFYTLLAVSTLLGKENPPYKNVICLGHVLDSKGQKMSKSKGNVVDPFVAIDKYGADVIRWYFYTVNQPGDPKRFDEKAVDEVTKKVFLILWNVLTYYKMYAGPSPKAPSAAPRSANELDRWLLAELARVREAATKGLEAYAVIDAGRELAGLVDSLSTWYVRRSRDRFKSGTDAEKADALATLGYALRTIAGMMAPFTPFVADALYAEVGGEKESVHLAEWPAAMQDDKELREAMDIVRQTASLGLEARAKAAIPVRQALASATIASAREPEAWMKEILMDELNVEAVLWQKAEGPATASLDTVITPALKRKGAARELVRNINEMRKNSGLTIQDRVVVTHSTESEFWHETLKEHGESLKIDVKADAIEKGRSDGDAELASGDEKIWVGIRKV
ncbi:MAG TPA: class I tRNA ligase family protein [Candidatus Eisenbacteria bacterium]|nr:class I tRNA ligase family protein [Candidatus Eisenbacteria bacterium]